MTSRKGAMIGKGDAMISKGGCDVGPYPFDG
jgi:hypothetical protein